MPLKVPPMGSAVKLIVPLVLVAAIGISGAMAWQRITRLTGENTRLQRDLTQSRDANAKLSSEQQELTQQISRLQSEQKTSEERLSSLRAQLTEAMANMKRDQDRYGELASRAEQVAEERDRVSEELSRLTGARDTAQQQAKDLEQKHAEVQRSITRLRERFALLERDYQQVAQKLAEAEARPNSSLAIISSVGPTPGSGADGAAPAPPAVSSIPGTVELPPIIVRKDQAGISVPVRGRVVEVNDPHGFLVVDKGSMDGVRVGMVFDILRGANPVGRASVLRVRPQLSACDIVRSSTPGVLQPGDVAVQRGP